MTPKPHTPKKIDAKAPLKYVWGAFKAQPMKADQRKYVQTKGPTKTFQKDGHWIEKPNSTPIILCACGNRYLKTRPGQTKCLRCTNDINR